MAGLFRTVAGKQIILHERAQDPGNEGTGCRNEAVDYNRAAVKSSGQHTAGNCPDFKSTHLGKHIQAVGGIRGIYGDAAGNRIPFAGEPFNVHAGSASNHFPRFGTAYDSPDGGGRSGIADTHISGTQNFDTILIESGGFLESE